MIVKKGLSTNVCKKCSYCNSRHVKKNGKKSGIQRYKCLDCNKNFSSKRRPEKLEKSLFKEYIYK